MISFFFKQREIQATVTKTLRDWELNSEQWGKPEVIAENMKYDLERYLQAEVMKHVQMELDKGLLDEMAKRAIAEFNLQEMYGIALKEKIKEIMFSNGGRL